MERESENQHESNQHEVSGSFDLSSTTATCDDECASKYTFRENQRMSMRIDLTHLERIRE